MLLTNACAILPELRTADHDPEAERRALRQLAAACNRFSPWCAPDAPDGIWIEATGLAHLFGGEEALLERITEYFRNIGFAARAAMAGTPGAAWALARFGNPASLIAPSGQETYALASLPVRALRIDTDSATLLNRLGLKTIGQILDIPRASLRSRFGTAITCRIDQALGKEGEAISPLMPEPVYAARTDFADPLTVFAGLEQTVRHLIEDTAEQLKADGKGARRFTLMLFDTRNGKTELSVRLARPSCEPAHIARLLREKLSSLEGRFDPNAGFDTAVLYALHAEPFEGRQADLLNSVSNDDNNQVSISRFLDRVTARLGETAVSRFGFSESYWPERATFHRPATAAAQAPALSALALPRPITLLPRPEPIEVIALVPDYPPRRFTWRRCLHEVVRAEGPERISPEWWHEGKIPPARDYYIVEDGQGQRFWLYREGIYGQSPDQRWFLHGFFP